MSSAHFPRHKVGCKYIGSMGREEEGEGGDIRRGHLPSISLCHRGKTGFRILESNIEHKHIILKYLNSGIKRNQIIS